MGAPGGHLWGGKHLKALEAVAGGREGGGEAPGPGGGWAASGPGTKLVNPVRGGGNGPQWAQWDPGRSDMVMLGEPSRLDFVLRRPPPNRAPRGQKPPKTPKTTK